MNDSANNDMERAIRKIVTDATRDHGAYELLRSLTDDVGPRPSGSAQADAAVVWAENALTSRGIRAWQEEVVVPHWVRGEAEAHIVADHRPPISLLALGGSPSTPPDGLEAEVVMVRSLEEIDAAGSALEGKIVFMSRPMNMDLVRMQRAFEAYRVVSPLRMRGAARAARHGAAAFLIRSLGSASYRLPHAGSQRFEDGVPRIPAASISAEDADLIERLLERGPVRVSLRLTSVDLPDKTSANVVGEVEGLEADAGIILIGAHLDSWDVSPGAHDNGSGVVMVIETLRLMAMEGLRPKRTVRGVLFMNEEHGGHGGIAYHAAHRSENIVAVAETDHGAYVPVGFDTTLSEKRSSSLRPMMELLESLEVLAPKGGRASRLEQSANTGVDTTPFRNDGVPGFGLMPDSTHYFDLHHTAADTLDKVDPEHLARCVATFASLVHVLAEHGVPE